MNAPRKRFTGRRLIAAASLAAVAIVALIAGLPPMLHWMALKRTEAKVAQVREDFRALNGAFKKYGLDRCGIYFPPDTSARHAADPSVALVLETLLPGKPDAVKQPLSTPVAYIDWLPGDPFRQGKAYGYIQGGAPLGILHSPGPDGVTQIDLPRLREKVIDIRSRRTKQASGLPTQPHQRAQIRRLIDPFMYDPTNGIMSTGDMILVIDMHRVHWGFGWEGIDTADWYHAAAEAKALEIKRAFPECSYRALTIPLVVQTLFIGAGRFVPPDRIHGIELILEQLRGLSVLDFATSRARSMELAASAIDDSRKLAPRWWQASAQIQRQAWPYGHPLPPEAALAMLELHARTQVALAAMETGEGSPERARNRLDALRGVAKGTVKSRDEPISYPEEKLRRLLAWIESQIVAIEGILPPQTGGA